MSCQEYSIRVPKNNKKKFQVMRFNNSVNVDFTKWSQVKMERENNMKEFKGLEEEQPKFGAGSEFGRDAREEARRKKFGIISKKYRAEDQPWLLKVGGKAGKKFKGIREGGVAENASYYVFTHAADGAIEAFPLQEWYNFQPIQCYKSLSAEEAEQEFGRRNKLMNYFSLMMRKRLRGDEEGDLDENEDGKLKKGSKKKELQISEMDDWVDSEDESSSNSEEEKEKKDPDESDNKKNKKGKDKGKKKNKKRRASDSEACEESDDGDEEGREMDYISDSSASDSDKELKGVAEEDALRKLLSSGEEDEDEEKQEDKNKEKDSDDNDNKTKEGDNADSKDNPSSKDGNKSNNSKKKKKKNKKPTNDKKRKDDSVLGADSSSDWSSDSDGPSGVTSTSRSATPTQAGNSNDKSGTSSESANDRKRSIQAVLAFANNDSPPAKQSRFEPLPIECGITEDAVRRYLARKPMTTTELLQKFKSKKTGLSSDQLVNTMTLILKRINPTRQTIKGKMYLSIPNDKRNNQLASSETNTSGGPDMQI